MQSSLFTPRLKKVMDTIVHDDGIVRYYPNFFTKDESDRFYAAFTSKNIRYQQDKIMMYGKWMEVPRLTSWYGDPKTSYKYSDTELLAYGWLPEILEIKSRIEPLARQTYNSALLNWYRNGNDGVAWHGDDERSLGDQPVIVSVSFGQPRYFRMRHKTQKTSKKVLLSHGDVVIMSGDSQHCWQHAVLRTTKEEEALNEPPWTHGRINLTFRRIFREQK